MTTTHPKKKLVEYTDEDWAEHKANGTTPAPFGYLRHIPVEKVAAGPWQPRTKFDEEALQELAASITADGITTPLQVRPNPDRDGDYLIVSGERRHRAACIAGLQDVPCIVLEDADETKLRRRAMIENMHRRDLTPLEEARGLRELEASGASQRDMASELGKSQGWVSQRLSMLKLPDKALEALDNGVITVEDARELVKLVDEPKVLDMVLADDDRKLQKLVNNGHYGYIGHRITDRVKAVMDWKSREGDFQAKIEKLRRQGHVVVEDFDPDKRNSKYTHLSDGTVDDQAHKKAGLTCEAVAVVRGYSNYRVCTDPAALRKAVAELRKSGEIVEPDWKRQERERIDDARGEARLNAIQSWLREGAALGNGEIATVARLRVACLTRYDTAEASQAARWLGFQLEGSRSGAAQLVQEDARGSAEKCLSAWFVLELAAGVGSYRSEIIGLADEWLKAHGYVDPYPEPVKEAAPEEDDEPSHWCGAEGRCHECEKRESCNSAQPDGPPEDESDETFSCGDPKDCHTCIDREDCSDFAKASKEGEEVAV